MITLNAETGEWIVARSPKLSADEQHAFEQERDRLDLDRWNDEMDAKVAAALRNDQAALEAYDNQLRMGDESDWYAPKAARSIRTTSTSHISAGADQPSCPVCGEAFERRRKDQRYCSRSCQSHASRTSRRTENALQQQRERDLAAALFVAYVDAQREGRLGLIKSWLDAGRGGDRTLANVLRKPVPSGSRSLLSVIWAYRTERVGSAVLGYQFASSTRPEVVIPQLAEWFAQRFLDCHASEWVNGSGPEPEAGEEIDEAECASIAA